MSTACTPARLVLHQNKTWSENAIEHWLEMEPSDESAVLLAEIMREHGKELMSTGPRRLRKGMVLLRRVGAKEKRISRIRAAEFRHYYREGNLWPFQRTQGEQPIKGTTPGGEGAE